MNNFIFGSAILAILIMIVMGYRAASPRMLAMAIRQSFGVALLAFAGYSALTGRWVAALPLLVVAIMIMGFRVPRHVGGTPNGRKPDPAARRSTVRSAALEMELDHQSGVMSGRVLAGRFEGRELARLSIAELGRLWLDIRHDGESRSLLEAYLDRRHPYWRDSMNGEASGQEEFRSPTGGMTAEEAYQILGLDFGATEEEVREAHRRLMKSVHPDRGGSTFLAAKINEAKDRLSGKNRTRSGS